MEEEIPWDLDYDKRQDEEMLADMESSSEGSISSCETDDDVDIDIPPMEDFEDIDCDVEPDDFDDIDFYPAQKI